MSVLMRGDVRESQKGEGGKDRNRRMEVKEAEREEWRIASVRGCERWG